MTTTAATTVTAVSVAPFDEWSPRYRCCCGCCHVRCGAYTIGCLQSIGLASLLFNSGKAALSFDAKVSAAAYIPTILHATFFVACVICVIMLFVGLSSQKAGYLTPMIFLLVTSIGYYLLTGLFFVTAYALNTDSLTQYLSEQLELHGGYTDYTSKGRIREQLKVSIIVIVITSLLGALFDFWWFTVIKKCRQYLRDKSDWYLHHPGAQFSMPINGPSNNTGVNVVLISQQSPPAQPFGQPPVSENPEFGIAPPPSYNEIYKDEKINNAPPRYAPSAPSMS